MVLHRLRQLCGDLQRGVEVLFNFCIKFFGGIPVIYTKPVSFLETCLVRMERNWT